MDLDRMLNKTHLAQQIHTHTILKPKAEWLTMAYIKIHTSGTAHGPSIQEAEARGSRVRGQSGSHSKFEASLGYTVNPCHQGIQNRPVSQNPETNPTLASALGL